MQITLNFDNKFADKYSEYDLKMNCAVGLYKERIMSSGALAKVMGMNRLDFIEEMSKYGSGIMDMTEKELEMELKNAEKI